jgi:hypothetical protein
VPSICILQEKNLEKMSFVNFKVIIVLRLIKCAAIYDSMISNNITMTKSELIAMMASKQPSLLLKDVDLAANSIIAVLTATFFLTVSPVQPGIE